MKKLKLNLKDLKVESFETADEVREKKGTIHGNLPWTETCDGPTCNNDTCWGTCPMNTHCVPTCRQTCPIEPTNTCLPGEWPCGS